jgi:hypothetical protein
MSKKSEVSPKQKERIQQLSKHNLSSNQIQKTLQKEGLGIRRKTLLSEIRKNKHLEIKPHAERYIPIKYRRGLKLPPVGKTVVIEGTIHKKEIVRRRSGSGIQLYEWVKREMTSGKWDAKPKVKSE